MNNILTVLAGLGFLPLLWLFFFIFILHELEEWNIDRFERRNFAGLPAAATDKSARLWIACVILIGLVWIIAATLPGRSATAAWIFLPAIAILIQNALQHIYWSLYFRQYAPGVVTSLLLLIPLGLFIFFYSLQRGYVPAWYAAIWAAFILAGSVQTVLAGRHMTPPIRAINTIGILLAERLK